MKKFIVIYYLLAGTLLAHALSNTISEESEIKKLDDRNIDDIDISLEETSPALQRKRDPGYFYNKSNLFISNNYFPNTRHGHKRRVVTKLHHQVAFNQYGPPNHGSASHNQIRPIPTNIIIDQEVPVPIRQTEFIEESPIASQNNLPFGQHTAKYLPPKNQKLPTLTAPNLFSNKNHDFPRQHHQQQQQQQRLQLQQQQRLNQVQQKQRLQQQQLLQQQQHLDQIQQQNLNQLQQQQEITNDGQNSFGQDFSTTNFQSQQNEFINQQISDAALFLSQNAPAISQLYETPAFNQNYAPYNQEGNQNQIQNQNQHLQLQTQNEFSQFSNQQFPSHSSGTLNTQQSLTHVKSLDKDKLINQLRLDLSTRDNAANFFKTNEDIRNSHNQDSIPAISLFPPKNELSNLHHVGTSFNQPGSLSSASITDGSSAYQGYYPPPVAVPPTESPVLETPRPSVSSTFPPSHSGSESENTQIGTSLLVPGNVKPSTTSIYSQYGGFVPTFVAPTNFVTSIPSYGTTLFPPAPAKPAENSPTHFGIPIPTLPEERPLHSSPVPSTTSKPTSISLHPRIPTLSIPLGPLHQLPSHPQIIKPSPVSTIPAAVHPTYGLQPTVINPSFAYKPGKVYPVYYPHLGYSPPILKSVYSPTSTQPWSYASSYTQAKAGIWK